MAYGQNPTGITNPPPLNTFCDELKTMLGSNDIGLEVGMTSEGRLVNRRTISSPTLSLWGSAKSKETFESCQQNLKNYLAFHRQDKRLSERKIKAIPAETVPTLFNSQQIVMSLQEAERTPVDNNAVNDDDLVPEHPELRQGDLKKLMSFARAKLGHQYAEDVEDDRITRTLVLELFDVDKRKMMELKGFVLDSNLSDPVMDQMAANTLDDVFIAWKFPVEPPPPAHDGPFTGMKVAAEPGPQPAPVTRPPSSVDNLAQSVELMIKSYQGLPEQTERLLYAVGQLREQNPSLSGQVLGYLSTLSLTPESQQMLDRFMGVPEQPMEPPRPKLRSPSPQQSLQPPVQSPSEYMTSLVDEAKSLEKQKRYKEAFDQYCFVVEHCKREDNPGRYDKAVRSMSDIWREPTATEVDDYYYAMNKVVVHLEILSRNGDRYAPQLIELMITNAEAQQKLKQPLVSITPERPRQTGQWFHKPTEVGSMRMQAGQWHPYTFDKTSVYGPSQPPVPQHRWADSRQKDVPDMGDDCIRGNIRNPKVPPQDIKNLEYRVEGDVGRVSKKISNANQNAEQQGLTQDPHDEKYNKFKPGVSLRHSVFDGPSDFRSESPQRFPGAGIACARGKREFMEDAHQIGRFEFMSARERVPVTIAGVYDGHGGSKASRAVSNNIIAKLKERLEQYNEFGVTEAGIWNALKLAMIDLDRMDLFYANGTTACTTLVIQDRIWTVNVGDSRAMLALHGDRSLQLSEDAKPQPPVLKVDGTYVNDKYTGTVLKRGGLSNNGWSSGPLEYGSLSTARAIGDHFHGGAISARGKITSYKLDQENVNSYLVVGCDGIFDVATTSQVAQLIEHQTQINPGVTSEELAQEIVLGTYAAGSDDNLSVLVVPVRAMLS